MKKIRVFLDHGTPVNFKNSATLKIDKNCSLELLDFEVKQGNARWVIKLGNGQLIEGRVGVETKLSVLSGTSWITLAIPIRLHKTPKGLAPDFIINLPDYINPNYSNS